MAHIIGPKTGHAKLVGTRQADLIVAQGSGNTVRGAGGNDTIVATTGDHNRIVLGPAGTLAAYTDLVRIGGAGDTVIGGMDDILLAGDATDSRIRLGNGNDTINLDGLRNAVMLGGGNDMVRAVGGGADVRFTGQDVTAYADSVILTGAHNTVENTLSQGPYPDIGTLDIHGGSGFGTFVTGSTSGTVVTQGVHNFIEAGFGASTIVAGSGEDIVSLTGGYRDIGGTARVVLAGEHNLVAGTDDGATIVGGAGQDTIDLTGQSTAQDMFRINDTGQANSITIDTGHALIDPGSGNDTVAITSGVATMTFHGASDLLILDGAVSYAGTPTTLVNDASSGLTIDLTRQSGGYLPDYGNLTIDHFDPSGIVAFLDGRGGFTSVADIMHDLQATGPGSYNLVLPDGSGTITFLHTNDLTAANFRV